MRFKIFFTFSLVSFYLSGIANVVSVDTAQIVALNFFKTTASPAHSSSQITANLNYTQTDNDGTANYYIFDMSPAKGFVIVSAANNVSPILAYSTESNFRSDFPGIGIQGWMQHASSSVRQARILQTPADVKTAGLWSDYIQGQTVGAQRSGSVSPMLTTSWSQNPYYNILCPYDNTNQGRSVTGCVATAMAQIMKFWSFPSQGVGSYSYVDSQGVGGYNYNIGRLSADFGATKYEWSKMPSDLSTPDSTVALLLYHCGISVGMNYSARGSGAYFQYPGHACALNAFTAYFSYDAQTIKYVSKVSYTTSDWQTLIENELNQGRPVFYTGQDTGNIGGHAWVCDGYDANGNLHMNWGWGGTDNGYFAISDLDAAPYNFSWKQSAIIGIQPNASALSVDKVSEDLSINLYPNPAKNKITVIGNSSNENSQYAIYDAIGNKLSEAPILGEINTIDVSSLITGVYFLHLNSGSQISTHRFIVAR